jgi:hypothetical protein
VDLSKLSPVAGSLDGGADLKGMPPLGIREGASTWRGTEGPRRSVLPRPAPDRDVREIQRTESF